PSVGLGVAYANPPAPARQHTAYGPEAGVLDPVPRREPPRLYDTPGCAAIPRDAANGGLSPISTAARSAPTRGTRCRRRPRRRRPRWRRAPRSPPPTRPWP